MQSAERMPIGIGVVFQVPDDIDQDTLDSVNKRTNSVTLAPGDFLMTVQHGGDCYYTYALLKEADGNEWTRYFKVVKTFSGYTIPLQWRITTGMLSAEEIISALCAANDPHAYGPLVKRDGGKEPFESTSEEMLDGYFPCHCGISGPHTAHATQTAMLDSPLPERGKVT